MASTWSAGQRRFAAKAVRNKRLFLGFSLVGVALGIALAGYYGYRVLVEPSYPWGTRAALVVMILLNARQNLRQYRFATLLERTPDPGSRAADRPGI